MPLEAVAYNNASLPSSAASFFERSIVAASNDIGEFRWQAERLAISSRAHSPQVGKMTTSATHPKTTSPSIPQANPNPKAASASTSSLVAGIVNQLTSTMQLAVGEIRKIQLHSHFLSVNASIEAARAGSEAAGFGEVAKEIQRLSSKTESVADDIEQRTKESIHLVLSMAQNLCGTRLADIALNSLDLIDRNLYERTCDVRWWATDSAVVNALQASTPEATSHACTRLAVILDAYTVYLDIVLCDTQGNIIANGRTNQYTSTGQSVSDCDWFEQALATRSGGEFAFQSSHHCSLVAGQLSLIYSAAVRQDGNANSKPLGVLGVVFDWNALATAVLENASLSEEESSRTLRLIIDENFQVISSSRPVGDHYLLAFPEMENLLKSNKGYLFDKIDGKPVCIAFAKSPGFETYATGWNAVLIQQLE